MTELLELNSIWVNYDIFFITYHSQRKLNARTYTFDNLTKYPYKVILHLMKMIKILIDERPDWVISDGAEIAIPVFVAAKLLRIKTIFIESICRVNQPSFTGRLVYPISDVFFVQWSSLLSKYGSKARYEGGVI